MNHLYHRHRPRKTGLALTVVTTVFFMWGFVTVLNDILVPHLKALFELNYTQTMLIQFTFFSAYFLMSIPSSRILAKVGYQKSIVLGLVGDGMRRADLLPGRRGQGLRLVSGRAVGAGQRDHAVAGGGQPYVAQLGDPSRRLPAA
jgi:FHS family L-fucose permease-like MFS transporter